MAASDEVVREAVAGMTTGDMDRLGAMLSDDIVLHVPGSNQISGEYTGKEAFLGDFLGKLMSLTGGQFGLEPHEFLGSGEHAVGLYNITATRDGKTFTWSHVNVYHVRDGKVTEIWQHPGDPFAWNDFWS
jgi:ketosteroid isomerase-like protein